MCHNVTINLPVFVDTVIVSFIRIRRTAVNRDVLCFGGAPCDEGYDVWSGNAENGKDNNRGKGTAGNRARVSTARAALLASGRA